MPDATPGDQRAADGPAAQQSPSPLGVAAALWGALGVAALLVYAIVRLAGVVVVGFEQPWQWPHVAVAVGNGVFMAWSEGYRGFQQRFSPRSAARVKWLLHQPSTLRAALAPLFVMAYFDAPRRLKTGVYALTAGIVLAIVVIHALPQPWRAALDIGVVLGLAWGLTSFAVALWRTLRSGTYPASPEVPEAQSR